MPYFRRLKENEFSVPIDQRGRVASDLKRFFSADPSRNETDVPPQKRRVEHMSKLHQSDGLSILARYTSVVAIAIACSALPLKSGASDQARDDQVKVESSEDGRTETGGRS